MTEKKDWRFEQEIGLVPSFIPVEDFDTFGLAVVDILILGRPRG